MRKILCVLAILATISVFVFSGCGGNKNNSSNKSKVDSTMMQKVNSFAVVKLTTDINKLSEKEKQMLPILIEIAQIMDDLFWMQTYGNKAELLDTCKDDFMKKFIQINYGPWERLNDNLPFVPSFGEKPLGANFYPKDMTKEEFDKLANADKTSLYTVLRRNKDKNLDVVWYHTEYKEQLEKASELLKKAAELAEDPGFKNYLTLRAEALTSSDYQKSDMAWMDMKTNHLDFVVGPIENYEHALFGNKAAFECFILVKDMEWSSKLDKYIAMLPALQKELPVDAKFKKEVPGSQSDLGVYDAIYYAGDCNAGSKTIAINLPNDEEVQLKKGSRRLQLKNAMKAKFDNILVPISIKLIDSSQQKNIKFEAFFNNVMFHEVAHGLGIKNTINGKGTVRDALKDTYSAFEEAKADILGLFMVTKLIEMGEVSDITTEDCYVTYMAGIFRSVRFGAASSHGKANMMCFNFFQDGGAFTLNQDGTYRVDFDKMKEAMNKWSSVILELQGMGDYDGAKKYIEQNANIREQLQKELDELKNANIPVDIIFDQGLTTLGLK